MIRILLSYTVEPSREAETLEAVRLFSAAVSTNEPHTKYEVYQGDAPGCFFHYMEFESRDDEKRHNRAAYTERFNAELASNCSKGPALQRLNRVC